MWSRFGLVTVSSLSQGTPELAGEAVSELGRAGRPWGQVSAFAEVKTTLSRRAWRAQATFWGEANSH